MRKTVVAAFLHAFFLFALTSQDEATLIKIGALYNKDTESLKSVLEDVFKNELPRILQTNYYRLVLTPLNVDGKDLLSKDVASNFSSVFCIIDLACKDEKAFALSSLLQVPLMKVDAIEDETPHKYAMSIRPSYRVVSKALFDVMKFYSFNRVAVVYDARKSRQASVFYASARKWTQYNAEMMPELPLDNKYKLREALTSLLKSHIKQVILFSDQTDLTKIMNEALFVGINDKDLKWIASDLEVAGPNKTYPAILGMVGVSLHLSNQIAARDYEKRASKAIQRGALDYSLAMYGAVSDTAVVVGKAIESILMSREGREMIHLYESDENCPLRGMVKEGQGLGQRILHELRKVSFKGLTGDVKFDSYSGERMVQDGMDILNVLPQDVKKVGSWKPVSGGNEVSVLPMNSEEPDWLGCFYESVKCHNPGVPGPRPKIRLPKLSITTVLEPPFVEIANKSAKLEDLAGKVSEGVLQGFLIDVIKELSIEAKFEYEIFLRSDGSYSNVIEELKNQEKDMALVPITITAERELDIDFSKPFMDFSLSLIMQKAGEPPINNFAFLQPFTGTVWLSTVGVVLFITAMMCVMDYVSPFGYRARARESDEEPGNEFNLLNSLWFATASVLQQGPDNTPLAPSGRLLASTFWFFILILISTYTANLAAFFTIKRTADTINSLDALANQDDIKYGVKDGGSVYKFFEKSEDSLYRKMFSHMREYKTFVKDTKTGVERARTDQYAYITEYPYLEYYNQQKPCNTRLLKNLIQTKSYGIGLQRNSPYTNRITVAILKLREKNFIEKTRRSWWDDRSQCPKPSQKKTGNTQSLDVNNLAGVFIILLGGVVVSIVLVVIEIRCRKLVVFFTNSQRALKRRLSRETREQSRDPNNTRMRMGVVLSQGDRCRKDDDDEDDEDIPMENIRFVEPGIKKPNMINLQHHDKYAGAPESKL